MKKAIKQGCPLAPHLFDIVMDELHRGYRKIGGYKLDKGPKISSVGYCDDTVIFAEDRDTIEEMNDWTAAFMKFHQLTLSEKKTYYMGLDKTGNPVENEMVWPGTGKLITLKSPSQTIRYLGIHLSIDGNWSDQIGKSNAQIMNILACMRNRKLTLLQAGLLIKEVLGPKMEISFRHAEIPSKTLENWDKWLARAINGRADLQAASIHVSAVATIMDAPTFSDQYIIAKTMQTMEDLTKDTVMKTYFQLQADSVRSVTEEVENNIDADEMQRKLQLLDKYRFHIERNEGYRDLDPNFIAKQYKTKEGMSDTIIRNAKDILSPYKTIMCDDHPVPIRNTMTLWGINFKPHQGLEVIICTDGSTYEGEPSGAGLVFIDDDFQKHEYCPQGFAGTSASQIIPLPKCQP